MIPHTETFLPGARSSCGPPISRTWGNLAARRAGEWTDPCRSMVRAGHAVDLVLLPFLPGKEVVLVVQALGLDGVHRRGHLKGFFAESREVLIVGPPPPRFRSAMRRDSGFIPMAGNARRMPGAIARHSE